MEIADWLHGLSLERYAETCRDNAIDVSGIARAERGRSRKARRPPRLSQDHAECDRSASWRRGGKHCAACAGIRSDPTVADESGAEGTVSIVGIDELDPVRGGVSWISPIATALLKAQVGDVVTMRTPRGTEELEIIAIRYDELP